MQTEPPLPNAFVEGQEARPPVLDSWLTVCDVLDVLASAHPPKAGSASPLRCRMWLRSPDVCVCESTRGTRSCNLHIFMSNKNSIIWLQFQLPQPHLWQLRALSAGTATASVFLLPAAMTSQLPMSVRASFDPAKVAEQFVEVAPPLTAKGPRKIVIPNVRGRARRATCWVWCNMIVTQGSGTPFADIPISTLRAAVYVDVPLTVRCAAVNSYISKLPSDHDLLRALHHLLFKSFGKVRQPTVCVPSHDCNHSRCRLPMVVLCFRPEIPAEEELAPVLWL